MIDLDMKYKEINNGYEVVCQFRQNEGHEVDQEYSCVIKSQEDGSGGFSINLSAYIAEIDMKSFCEYINSTMTIDNIPVDEFSLVNFIFLSQEDGERMNYGGESIIFDHKQSSLRDARYLCAYLISDVKNLLTRYIELGK